MLSACVCNTGWLGLRAAGARAAPFSLLTLAFALKNSLLLSAIAEQLLGTASYTERLLKKHLDLRRSETQWLAVAHTLALAW